MDRMEFTPKNVEAMQLLGKAILQVTENAVRVHGVPKWVVIFACFQVARIFLNQYKEKSREMLLDQTAIPFLRNEPVDENRHSVITLH